MPAYGTLTDSSGTGVGLRYRWTGREWDGELGMYYMRARYYQPRIPAGDGPNPYVYASGSPLEYTDPSGLMKQNDGKFGGACFAISCMNWDGTMIPGGYTGFGGGGGGTGRGGDWDGDGRDDFSEFLNYTFGRQRWMNNCMGNPICEGNWWQVAWAIDHGFSEEAAADRARDALQFGRLRSATLPPDAGGNFRNGLTPVEDGLGLKKEHSYLNELSSVWVSSDPSELAWLIAHELAHIDNLLGGWINADTSIQAYYGNRFAQVLVEQEETRANCTAFRAVGRAHSHLNLRGGCR